MASLAYLKLQGVKGPSTIKGDRLDAIGLFSVRHDVGTPPGEEGSSDRLHHPIYVTKNIDWTTPVLHRSLTDGLEFAEGWITYYHMPRSGDETNYFSIVMTGIQVVSITSVMPTTQSPDTTDIHEYEDVGLIYKGINWTSNPPPIGLEDGTYQRVDFAEPEAKFGPGWAEFSAKAEVMDIKKQMEEEITKQLKEEAKKKYDESKKK